jgi:TonB-dependent SusC/RagA subfamily outer membrane receptor
VSLKASDSSGDVRGALAGVVIRSRIDEFSADREAQLQSGSSDTRSAILRKDQVINVTGDSVTFTARNKDGTSSVIRGVGSPAVVLRGSDSSAAEQPLIIVDGVISQDRAILKQLDPNRIESITILKGTAATELYGPQGANGVIQIKTKR